MGVSRIDWTMQFKGSIKYYFNWTNKMKHICNSYKYVVGMIVGLAAIDSFIKIEAKRRVKVILLG